MLRILFVSSVLLSTGCTRKKVFQQCSLPSNVLTTNANYVQPASFVLTVEGVECTLCAETVTEFLKKLPWCSTVRYYSDNAKYYIIITTEQPSLLRIEEINNMLQSEEFMCTYIDGIFIGKYVRFENDLLFVTTNGERFYIHTNNANHSYIDENQEIVMQGAVSFDAIRQKYIFTQKTN